MNEAIEGTKKTKQKKKAWCLGSEIFWEECWFYHDTKRKVPGKGVGNAKKFGMGFGEKLHLM